MPHADGKRVWLCTTGLLSNVLKKAKELKVPKDIIDRAIKKAEEAKVCARISAGASAERALTHARMRAAMHVWCNAGPCMSHAYAYPHAYIYPARRDVQAGGMVIYEGKGPGGVSVMVQCITGSVLAQGNWMRAQSVGLRFRVRIAGKRCRGCI